MKKIFFVIPVILTGIMYPFFQYLGMEPKYSFLTAGSFSFGIVPFVSYVMFYMAIP